MKEEKVVTRVFSMFDENGEFIEEGKTEITDKCKFFPENLVTARVSVGGDFPMQVAKFGWAKSSFHISVPCAATPEEIANTKVFVKKERDEFIGQEMTSYVEFLESKGINWSSVDSQFKK